MTDKLIYAAVDPDGFVGYYQEVVDLLAGPGDPNSPENPPYTFHRVVEKVLRTSAVAESARLAWNDGDPAWVDNDTVDPVDLAAALARCYTDIDAVVIAAVGARTEEYKDAEAAARAYRAAGYEGEVDVDVSSFALHNPTGEEQSNQWAADQIIARADAFASARKVMRSTRFASQAAMRAAATPAELATAVDAWLAFIAEIRTSLGLPPVTT